MNINGKTRVLGLIGNPVAHTQSPLIHNTIARRMGMNIVYLPFPVEKNLNEAIQGAFALQIQGMNVTVPYKSEVIPYLTQLDREAKLIGAVNTLVRTPQGYKGFNTDLPGLYLAMNSEGIQIEGKKVIIVGAGGAARAASFLCALKGVDELIILNRTIEHANKIAKEIQEKTGFQKVLSLSLNQLEQIEGNGYIALQATKAGLFPNTEETPIDDKGFFEKLSVVYDFIYSPSQTKFMKLACQNGVPSYHGLKMLLYQGILSFELWNQVKVPQAIIDEVYEELKRACIVHE